MRTDADHIDVVPSVAFVNEAGHATVISPSGLVAVFIPGQPPRLSHTARRADVNTTCPEMRSMAAAALNALSDAVTRRRRKQPLYNLRIRT